jgi:hypothetical protein
VCDSKNTTMPSSDPLPPKENAIFRKILVIMSEIKKKSFSECGKVILNFHFVTEMPVNDCMQSDKT